MFWRIPSRSFQHNCPDDNRHPHYHKYAYTNQYTHTSAHS